MSEDTRQENEGIVFDPIERERAASAAKRIRKPPFGVRPVFYPAPSPEAVAQATAAPENLPSLTVETGPNRTLLIATALTLVWLAAFGIYITTTVGLSPQASFTVRWTI